jgi:hypothetical protein
MDTKIFEYFYKMNSVMRYEGKNAPIMLAWLDNAWAFVIVDAGAKRKILAKGLTIEDLVKDFEANHPEGYKA